MSAVPTVSVCVDSGAGAGSRPPGVLRGGAEPPPWSQGAPLAPSWGGVLAAELALRMELNASALDW